MRSTAQPQDWDDLRVLLAVVRAGSFLAAADKICISVSTVSRRIRQLEKRIGSVLIERRTDGAYATPAGRKLAALAERMELDIAATARDSSSTASSLGGVIRLSVGDGFTDLLMDCVANFSVRHPNVDFEFIVESRAADLRKKEGDVAIRTTHKQEASLVYRRLGELRYALWASRTYIDRAGLPKTAKELDAHVFVGFAPPLDRHLTMIWLRELGAKRFVVRATSFRGQLAAVRRGLGVGALPRRAVRGLVEVLPGMSPKPLPLFLVAHPQSLRRREVRAFVDEAVAYIASQLSRS